MEGGGKKIAGKIHKMSRAGAHPFLSDDTTKGEDTDIRARIKKYEGLAFQDSAASVKKMFYSNGGVRYVHRQFRNMRASDHSQFVSTVQCGRPLIYFAHHYLPVILLCFHSHFLASDGRWRSTSTLR